jgi:SagB-type dehydrogenase family enzyme
MRYNRAQNMKKVFIALLSLSAFFALSYIIIAKESNSDEGLSIGERFHKETSITWLGVLGDMFRSKPKEPPQYKTYPDAKVIKLPKPKHKGIILEEAIKKRRSQRNYSNKAVTLNQLSQLVFAAQGATGKSFGTLLRTAPSAGALYPFEVYLIVNKVDDLPRGIYHYSAQKHALELLKSGDFRSSITKAALDQDMLGDSSVAFVLTSVFDRLRHKYGERGYRYAYMEAGHISQNIYLQATSLGLGSVAVGAFLDEKINKLIGIDGHNEAAIYVHAVGAL